MIKPFTERPNGFYSRYGKRLLDLALVLPALILLSPVIGLVALLVRLKLGTPVLFRQERPGKGVAPFFMLKFRTMTDGRDAAGILLSDSERLTPFGARLRATSLDELPELFNVLKGEMSLVGPRPLLTRYTPYFTQEERLRFSVRPGISGLAQVSGRNDLPWDERIALDVEYVQSISFAVDLRIMWRTLAAVFKRDGLQVDPGAVRLDFDVERRLSGEQLAAGGQASVAGGHGT